MSFTHQTLSDRLLELRGGELSPARYLVAFSGGLDSTVLLHALSAMDSVTPIVAVHIDHQLCEESGNWESHCRDFARTLGVQYSDHKTSVPSDQRLGPEAAARAARYGVFATLVEDNDWLLSAHHESDQAETLLLNLLRGSGPTGLAGISSSRRFAKGRLVRPMLEVTKAQIEDYAKRENLRWIEDPSNLESRFDRNFLRNDVMPVLESRWPAAIRRLSRSAALAGEARSLLDDLAKTDLEAVGGAGKIEISSLRQLDDPRQRNLLRYAFRQLELPSPPATRLSRIVSDLVNAREDGQPLVTWPGVEVRRYRGRIYLLASGQAPLHCDGGLLTEKDSFDLGPGMGRLSLTRSDGPSIDPAIVASGLAVRFREGGESIRPFGHDHSQKLKKLLQDAAVVPWMRARIPLLYSGDDLVAVADLWMAAEFSQPTGCTIKWHGRPAIN